MSYFYAEIDLTTSKVIGVSQLHSIEEKETLIPIEAYDESLVGKSYVEGEFVEVE